MTLNDDINNLPSSVQENTTNHLDHHKTIHAALKSHAPRVEALEVMGGLTPGEPVDGQTANLIGQPDTLTRAAVESAAVRVVNERLPEYIIGPTGEYLTVDDFIAEHPLGDAKVILQSGLHFVSQLPSDGSLRNFSMEGQGMYRRSTSIQPTQVTTVETLGPLIETISGDGNLRFSDFNLRNTSSTNTDNGLRFEYPRSVTIERLNIYGYGGSSIWLAGGVDSEVSDNYILARDYTKTNGFAGVHISKRTDDYNSANTTTHLQRNYIGSGKQYGFYFDGVSIGAISIGDIAEGCQVGFYFHRAPMTVISPYTEANDVGMQSLDTNPMIIGSVRDELIQTWSTGGISVFNRGATRLNGSWMDMGRGILMSARDGHDYGDFANSMSIRVGTLEPNGHYTAPTGSTYYMRGGTNGKTMWHKYTNEGNQGWLPIGHFTVSQNEISSITSWLNVNKRRGMNVWCHTLNIMVHTEASSPEAPWINTITGEIAITPA